MTASDRRALWEVARIPLLVWLGLCLLLALTCALAYAPLGRGNLPVSLCIAAIKAGLVAGFFMRLGEPNALNRLAAGAGLVWLFVMFVLIGSDYFTR